MTSVQPPLGSALPARAGSAAPVPAAAVDFEALVDIAGNDQGCGAAGREDFKADVAHVFNAFGFFSDDPAQRAAHQSGIHASIAASSDPPPKHLPSAGENPALGPAAVGPVAATARVRGVAPAPVGGIDAQRDGSGPEAIAERLAIDAAGSGLPAAAVHTPRPPSTRSAGAHVLPGTVIGFASRIAPRNGESDVRNAPAGYARRSPDAPSGDRLSLRIAANSAELVGRLAGLGEDDERRLVEALAELLARHGLTLRAAIFNGRPVAPATNGGED
jgi:hypothetical protein